MKKFTAMLLVVTMIFGLAVPAFAAGLPGWLDANHEEKTAAFLELLTEEARAEIEAVGENFAAAIVAWMFELDLGGLPPDEVEEIMAEAADFINNDPDWSVEEMIWWLELAGLWGIPLLRAELAEQFSFGTDFTREDIAEVADTIIEFFAEHYDFDFGALLEAAGLSMDEYVNFLWVLLNDSEEAEWFISRHGEEWIFYAVFEMTEIIFEEADWGEEYAVMYLRLMHLAASVIELFGTENLDTIFDALFELEWFFDYDAVLMAMTDNRQFLETLEELVEEHGMDGLLAILDFDAVEDIEEFVSYGTLTPALEILDALLGGLVSENRDYLAEALEDVRAWERQYEYFFERIRLMNSVPQEEFDITADNLEERFSTEITNDTGVFVLLEDIGDARLNLSFRNRGDATVTIVYFVTCMFTIDIYRFTAEIEPGRRFTTQINFSELFTRRFFGDVVVFLLGEDGTDPHGDFTFRLTENPLS